jgi:hypothetical protein
MVPDQVHLYSAVHSSNLGGDTNYQDWFLVLSSARSGICQVSTSIPFIHSFIIIIIIIIIITWHYSPT